MNKRVVVIGLIYLMVSTALYGQSPNYDNSNASDNPATSTNILTLSHAQANKLALSAKLKPLSWYFLEDKNVYLCAITPSHFMLQGYCYDAVVHEVDLIQYDFKNAHIQKRCDARGNCVGAMYKVIELGIISVDPILVFKWGDDLVQDNEVNNAVLDLTGLQNNNYGILSNTINAHAEVAISNVDSLFFIKNTCSNSVMVSVKGTSGSIYDNDFSSELTVIMDNANITVSDNELSGAEKTFDISGAQGRYGGNKGVGNIWCRKCGPNTSILSANLFDGASIYADSMNAHINAVELHRGSELHMAGSDSAFSKSFLDFTAIVHADNNKNRSEYNRFIGCGDGFGTHFYATMSPNGYLCNNSFYSCKTVTLDSALTYNMQVYDSRNPGLNATPDNSYLVKGNIFIDPKNEHLRVVHLRRFANDDEALKGGLSPYMLYINSETGAISIMQGIIDH